ncbi:MAG TPA: Rossmann-like and DUF2520 domain-containing protein [Solirubrobacteraceae bacterium]
MLSPETSTPQTTIAIVGAGRLGTALAEGLRGAGHAVLGPLPRDYDRSRAAQAGTVLLCVPDREIPAAAAYLADGLTEGERCPLVGHCSGACTLDVLEPIPRAARFSLHPLMTFAGGRAGAGAGATGSDKRGSDGHTAGSDGHTAGSGTHHAGGDGNTPSLHGATAAIAGGGARALSAAGRLARELRLTPVELDEADRAAYHAAASMASNFLITLELAAERLAASAGLPREALVPLVRQSVENWAHGGAAALTGPIARGDTETVRRQRAAVAQRAPELLGLFDALANSTQELAQQPAPAGMRVAA